VPPKVRSEVYDTYWYFASERQAIFERRVSGQLGPWTTDEILGRFKFCNTFRASDRVSQYLIGRVIYDGREEERSPADTFLRIVLFRLFSKESTWDALEQATGGVSCATLAGEQAATALDQLRERQSIYTAAFILCAHDAFRQPSKHRNHLALVHHMFGEHKLARSLAQAQSLQEVYELLLGFPMIGPFMAYQLTIDLNYSPHLNFSENDFTVPGPGAVRGLRKVFSDFGKAKPAELIQLMVERQGEEFSRLELPFRGLWGRPLHAIDCQGLFCETDKYSRERFPELKSNRQRIKQSFAPQTDGFDLFYPPKWRINEAVAASRGAPQLRLIDGGAHQPPPPEQAAIAFG
jgi:hypothetical protein